MIIFLSSNPVYILHENNSHVKEHDTGTGLAMSCAEDRPIILAIIRLDWDIYFQFQRRQWRAMAPSQRAYYLFVL